MSFRLLKKLSVLCNYNTLYRAARFSRRIHKLRSTVPSPTDSNSPSYVPKYCRHRFLATPQSLKPFSSIRNVSHTSNTPRILRTLKIRDETKNIDRANYTTISGRRSATKRSRDNKHTQEVKLKKILSVILKTSHGKYDEDQGSHEGYGYVIQPHVECVIKQHMRANEKVSGKVAPSYSSKKKLTIDGPVNTHRSYCTSSKTIIPKSPERSSSFATSKSSEFPSPPRKPSRKPPKQPFAGSKSCPEPPCVDEPQGLPYFYRRHEVQGEDGVSVKDEIQRVYFKYPHKIIKVESVSMKRNPASENPTPRSKQITEDINTINRNLRHKPTYSIPKKGAPVKYIKKVVTTTIEKVSEEEYLNAVRFPSQKQLEKEKQLKLEDLKTVPKASNKTHNITIDYKRKISTTSVNNPKKKEIETSDESAKPGSKMEEIKNKGIVLPISMYHMEGQREISSKKQKHTVLGIPNKEQMKTEIPTHLKSFVFDSNYCEKVSKELETKFNLEKTPFVKKLGNKMKAVDKEANVYFNDQKPAISKLNLDLNAQKLETKEDKSKKPKKSWKMFLFELGNRIYFRFIAPLSVIKCKNIVPKTHSFRNFGNIAYTKPTKEKIVTTKNEKVEYKFPFKYVCNEINYVPPRPRESPHRLKCRPTCKRNPYEIINKKIPCKTNYYTQSTITKTKNANPVKYTINFMGKEKIVNMKNAEIECKFPFKDVCDEINYQPSRPREPSKPKCKPRCKKNKKKKKKNPCKKKSKCSTQSSFAMETKNAKSVNNSIGSVEKLGLTEDMEKIILKMIKGIIKDDIRKNKFKPKITKAMYNNAKFGKIYPWKSSSQTTESSKIENATTAEYPPDRLKNDLNVKYHWQFEGSLSQKQFEAAFNRTYIEDKSLSTFGNYKKDANDALAKDLEETNLQPIISEDVYKTTDISHDEDLPRTVKSNMILNSSNTEENLETSKLQMIDYSIKSENKPLGTLNITLKAPPVKEETSKPYIFEPRADIHNTVHKTGNVTVTKPLAILNIKLKVTPVEEQKLEPYVFEPRPDIHNILQKTENVTDKKPLGKLNIILKVPPVKEETLEPYIFEPRPDIQNILHKTENVTEKKPLAILNIKMKVPSVKEQILEYNILHETENTTEINPFGNLNTILKVMSVEKQTLEHILKPRADSYNILHQIKNVTEINPFGNLNSILKVSAVEKQTLEPHILEPTADTYNIVHKTKNITEINPFGNLNVILKIPPVEEQTSESYISEQRADIHKFLHKTEDVAVKKPCGILNIKLNIPPVPRADIQKILDKTEIITTKKEPIVVKDVYETTNSSRDKDLSRAVKSVPNLSSSKTGEKLPFANLTHFKHSNIPYSRKSEKTGKKPIGVFNITLKVPPVKEGPLEPFILKYPLPNIQKILRFEEYEKQLMALESKKTVGTVTVWLNPLKKANKKPVELNGVEKICKDLELHSRKVLDHVTPSCFELTHKDRKKANFSTYLEHSIPSSAKKLGDYSSNNLDQPIFTIIDKLWSQVKMEAKEQNKKMGKSISPNTQHQTKTP